LAVPAPQKSRFCGLAAATPLTSHVRFPAAGGHCICDLHGTTPCRRLLARKGAPCDAPRVDESSAVCLAVLLERLGADDEAALRDVVLEFMANSIRAPVAFGFYSIRDEAVNSRIPPNRRGDPAAVAAVPLHGPGARARLLRARSRHHPLRLQPPRNGRRDRRSPEARLGAHGRERSRIGQAPRSATSRNG